MDWIRYVPNGSGTCMELTLTQASHFETPSKVYCKRTGLTVCLTEQFNHSSYSFAEISDAEFMYVITYLSYS